MRHVFPVTKLISPTVFPLFGQINTSRATQPEGLVVKVRLRRIASVTSMILTSSAEISILQPLMLPIDYYMMLSR